MDKLQVELILFFQVLRQPEAEQEHHLVPMNTLQADQEEQQEQEDQ